MTVAFRIAFALYNDIVTNTLMSQKSAHERKK